MKAQYLCYHSLLDIAFLGNIRDNFFLWKVGLSLVDGSVQVLGRSRLQGFSIPILGLSSIPIFATNTCVILVSHSPF